jgi:hypothetical protein
MKCIVGSDYDSNKAYILSGCVNSGTGSNFVISAGYIFYSSEVHRVPASSFTAPSGQTAVINFNVTNVNGTNYDPVQFTDGSSIDIHYENIITIASGVSGSGISDFANLLRINEHQHLQPTLNSGYVVGSGIGIVASRSTFQQVVLEGNFFVSGGSVSMNTAFANLPQNTRPLHALIIPCCVKDGSNSVLMPAKLLVYTNGDCFVQADNMAGYPTWKNKLIKTIDSNYKRAPHFKSVFPLLQEALNLKSENISNLATLSLKLVAAYIGINTIFVESSVKYLNSELNGQNRIIDICKRESASNYINLSGGMKLYSTEEFSKAGIKLNFLKTKNIEYKQYQEPFVPNLSIIDVLMFNDVPTVQYFLGQYELF